MLGTRTQGGGLKRSLCVATTALLSFASPSVAGAQVPLAPLGAEAAGHDSFQRGLALLRAERWVEAVPELEAAVREAATPVRLYNLALAYRGAARMAAACEAFERYLARPEAGASEARLVAVREALDALQHLVARMQLTVSPASAVVRLDGRSVAWDGGALRVDPGVHSLEVEAPAHVPHRRELNLRAGELFSLELRLDAVPPPTPLPRVEAPAVAPPVVARPARELFPATPSAPARRSWVLPTMIAGGVVVVAAVVAGVLVATRGVADPTAGNWETVREP